MIKVAASLYLLAAPVASTANVCEMPVGDEAAHIMLVGQATGQLNIRLTIAPRGSATTVAPSGQTTTAASPYRRSIERSGQSTVVVTYH